MIKTLIAHAPVIKNFGEIVGYVTVGYERDEFGDKPFPTFEVKDARTGEVTSLSAGEIWELVMKNR